MECKMLIRSLSRSVRKLKMKLPNISGMASHGVHASAIKNESASVRLALDAAPVRTIAAIQKSGFKSTQSTPMIAQGVRGQAGLMTGNFSYFTKHEAMIIQEGLNRGKMFVLVYDRDSISVPANERAMWIREHFKHHTQLEVRVVYGAPAEKEGNEAQQASYLKRQIPSDVQISSVHCNHSYSSMLAKELGVSCINSSRVTVNENAIKQNLAVNKDLLFPKIANRVISPFQNTINTQYFKRMYEQQKSHVQSDIEQLNPNHPNKNTFFTRTRWNTADLARVNLPIITGKITSTKLQAAFSRRTNAQVFDMPIYMPGQGWKIPTELAPYYNVIAKIVAAESLANKALTDCNAYITIDCGIVFPQGLARRGGLHVDGFLTRANARASKDNIIWGDNTYVVSDVASLQTEFYPGPFDLSAINIDDPQAVLNAFDTQGRTMSYKQYDPYDIVRLTTNNVHAVHANMSNMYLQRSFLKMTFSERLFNRGGNTINPGFNYQFTYVPRGTDRNTQNFIGTAPVGFDEVDLREINFTSAKLPQWVTPTLFRISKNPNIHITATLATEGEIVETIINNQVITTNVARAGDMRVSRTNGDSYFLGAKFRFLYHPTEKENIYTPAPRTLTAVQVNRNITFPAPWGTRQNIPAGGYIVGEEDGREVWGVHQQSFEATYRKLK